MIDKELMNFWDNNPTIMVDKYTKSPREFCISKSGISSVRNKDDIKDFSYDTIEYLMERNDQEFLIDCFSGGNPNIY